MALLSDVPAEVTLAEASRANAVTQLPSLLGDGDRRKSSDSPCVSKTSTDTSELILPEVQDRARDTADTWRHDVKEVTDGNLMTTSGPTSIPVRLPRVDTPPQTRASTPSTASGACGDVVMGMGLDVEDAHQTEVHIGVERMFSGDSVPMPVQALRKVSDATFYKPEQTLIIFDWDDTLCPSTTCMARCGINRAVPLTDSAAVTALQDVASEAAALIQRASELAAKVVIVTNAGDGWVAGSCAAWMPELQDTLQSVEVCSARAKWEPSGVSSPTGWKAREFHNVIDRFYSRYQNQSWKNVVAVGDAPYEHEALERVVEKAPHCRSKSVRFVTQPSIEQLAFQIRVLRETLDSIVYHDGDLDIHIPTEFLPVELD